MIFEKFLHNRGWFRVSDLDRALGGEFNATGSLLETYSALAVDRGKVITHLDKDKMDQLKEFIVVMGTYERD